MLAFVDKEGDIFYILYLPIEKWQSQLTYSTCTWMLAWSPEISAALEDLWLVSAD